MFICILGVGKGKIEFSYNLYFEWAISVSKNWRISKWLLGWEGNFIAPTLIKIFSLFLEKSYVRISLILQNLRFLLWFSRRYTLVTNILEHLSNFQFYVLYMKLKFVKVLSDSLSWFSNDFSLPNKKWLFQFYMFLQFTLKFYVSSVWEGGLLEQYSGWVWVMSKIMFKIESLKKNFILCVYFFFFSAVFQIIQSIRMGWWNSDYHWLFSFFNILWIRFSFLSFSFDVSFRPFYLCCYSICFVSIY